jgi:hypothetical protein
MRFDVMPLDLALVDHAVGGAALVRAVQRRRVAAYRAFDGDELSGGAGQWNEQRGRKQPASASAAVSKRRRPRSGYWLMWIVPDSIVWPPATGDSMRALYVTVPTFPKQRLAVRFGSIVADSCCLRRRLENPDWQVTSSSAFPRNSTATGVLR